MKYQLCALLFAGLCLFSCKNPSDSTSAPSTTTPPAPVAQQSFKSVTAETMQMLFDKCDYLDYIFHDMPFAMSQNDKPSIITNLGYISQDVQPSIPAGCKSIARQMFHINGEIVVEFDVYFNPNNGCAFYTQMVNEKIVAANKMTETGLKFYSGIIQQALQQAAQKQQR